MNELYHHGIKGQKWGVRNGPPYPVEKGNRSGKQIADDNKRKSFLNGQMGRSVKSLKDGMDPATAYFLSYTAIMTTAVIASYVHLKKDRKRQTEKIETQYENRKTKDLKSIHKVSEKESSEESMKKTNPDYPSEGTTVNCTFCTMSMAMRKKGYDVIARKTDEPWYSDIVFDKAFNAKTNYMHDARTETDVIKKLQLEGNGSYGGLGVQWILGGGHSIFWENDNGKIRIYDGQSGTEYDTSGPNSIFQYTSIPNTSYTRLDNAQPTEKVLAFVEERGELTDDSK